MHLTVGQTTRANGLRVARDVVRAHHSIAMFIEPAETEDPSGKIRRLLGRFLR